MTRLLRVVALLTLLLTVGIVLLLPPETTPATPPDFALTWPVAKGAYHVHSSRSDGTGTLDDIAAAAARAGLQFVIVTDHGDGTRDPEPPSYRSGVLCIDGVEISTELGHYVALDLPRTPYRLAGHPREVIEDVSRFGGFGFIAHPGSPKPALRWADWDAPFPGLEWLNADSEWRDEFWGSLGAVLLTYAFRPVETLAGLLDRAESVLRRWDVLVSKRRVAAIAGADAHARLGYRQASDPYDDRVLARLPAYDVSFRAFVNHAILDRPLTGDAAVDAALVTAALREGRIFTSIDGLAQLSAFEAKAESGLNQARPGEYLTSPDAVAIHAQIAAPAGTRLVVIRDGQTLYEAAQPIVRLDIGRQPGAYRVEAHLPARKGGSTVPWVVSNPMYVGVRAEHERLANTPALPPLTERMGIETWLWRPEASPGSSSTLDVQTTTPDGIPGLAWRYSLAAGSREQQYSAIRFPRDAGLAGLERVQLRARGDAPARIWVQLRAPGSGLGERWGRTFFVDTTLQSIDLAFSEFRPIGQVSAERPPLDRVDSILLVVDTLHHQPGSTGTLWIAELWVGR